jgi:hypothetical protein
LVLLATAHYLVLEDPEHPLAAVYRGESDADPYPLFRDLCLARQDEVAFLLETRRVQTNECGRSAVIAPGLNWVSSHVPGPFALVDVGASAGLNLMFDKYRIDYGVHGSIGPADSPVQISCKVVQGDPPIWNFEGEIVSRVGIDRSPIDLLDHDDVRWQLACVWPDTGRLGRTAASIALAEQDPPFVIEGDANQKLPEVLSGFPKGLTPVVATTWAFSYFSLDDRARFSDILRDASSGGHIVWLSAESPGVVSDFHVDEAPVHDGAHADLLGVVVFNEGASRSTRLGYVHQHGSWIDWAPLEQ